MKYGFALCLVCGLAPACSEDPAFAKERAGSTDGSGLGGGLGSHEKNAGNSNTGESEAPRKNPLKNDKVSKSGIDSPGSAKPTAPKPKVETFGADISAEGDAYSASLLAFSHADLNGEEIRVSGYVAKVDPTEGKWLTLRDGGVSLRVEFKDKTIVMPKNSVGRKVVLEGVFSYEMTPPEDGSPQPKLAMKVVADGLRMRRGF